MGPSGCGKSTIAKALSLRMSWPMVEADDHHPQKNVDKMSRGVPLTDTDRIAWMDNMIATINADPSRNLVLACSALTPYVQSRLLDDTKHECRWWLIDLPRGVLEKRLTARLNHFMPVNLLDSQLASLSPPSDARRIHGDQPIDSICNTIVSHL